MHLQPELWSKPHWELTELWPQREPHHTSPPPGSLDMGLFHMYVQGAAEKSSP